MSTIHSFIYLTTCFVTSKPSFLFVNKKDCQSLFQFFFYFFSFCFQVDNSFGGDNKSFCSLWPAVCACVLLHFEICKAQHIKLTTVFYFTVDWALRVSSHTLPANTIEIQVPVTQFRLFVSFFVWMCFCVALKQQWKRKWCTH